MIEKLNWAVTGRRRTYAAGVTIIVALGCLLLIKLGSLTAGLALVEQHAATAPVGWHGIYHQAFYLPLELVRSVDFRLFVHHGQTLTRLPNVLFGALTIVSFAWLVQLWHGTRVAVLAGILFACSAWVLHVSRLASFDVLYLWAIPALLLSYTLLQRHPHKTIVYYGSIVLWGLLLYVPGLIWILLVNAYFQRGAFVKAWRQFGSWWQRFTAFLLGVIWLPLLVVNLGRPGALRTWVGLPLHLDGPLTLLKHFVGVFVHIFIRGPQYPQLWLARAPVLDLFTFALAIAGLIFYGSHFDVSRSRFLGALGVVGAVLVALGGPVSLSLLMPLAYLAAAMGLAYLLREWLKVFPLNPLARNLGIGLICAAVALSCLYNIRSYFVAWPHADTTTATFRYRP